MEEEEGVVEWLRSALEDPKRDIGLKIEGIPGSKYMRIAIENRSLVKEFREAFERARPILEAERGYPVTLEYLMLEAVVHAMRRMEEAKALIDIVALAEPSGDRLVEMRGCELIIEKPLRERIERCSEKLNAEPSVLVQNILESKLKEIEDSEIEDIEGMRRLIEERKKKGK